MPGGGGSQTTTKEPWEAAQPALERAIGTVERKFNNGNLAPKAYTGRRVAAMSQPTLAGMQGLRGAVDPGAYGAAAGDMDDVFSTARGGFNDFMSDDAMYRDFDRIKGTVADDVKASLGGTFAGGGLESGLAQETYARGLGDAMANVEYGAYGDQQNRKLSALGMAGQLQGMAGAGNDYATKGRMLDANNDLMAGGMRDSQSQQVIDAKMARFREKQMQPVTNMQQYLQNIMGLGGMGGVQVSPQQGPSAFGSAAGGALSGAAAGAPLGPWGMAAGGVLGGLSGIF